MNPWADTTTPPPSSNVYYWNAFLLTLIYGNLTIIILAVQLDELDQLDKDFWKSSIVSQRENASLKRGKSILAFRTPGHRPPCAAFVSCLNKLYLVKKGLPVLEKCFNFIRGEKQVHEFSNYCKKFVSRYWLSSMLLAIAISINGCAPHNRTITKAGFPVPNLAYLKKYT